MKFGNEIAPFEYSSPQQYPISNGFCDNMDTDIKTISYTIQNSQKIQVEFQITISNNNGQVSIKNIYISRLLCYPLCKSCTGPEYNQCTSCINGSPNNNRCSLCPNNQFMMPGIGCSLNCYFNYRPTYEKICVSFETTTFYTEQTDPNETRYVIILPSLTGESEQKKISHALLHEFYIMNAGLYRFIDLSSFDQGSYLIGLKIVISFYGSIPVGRRIEFQIIEVIQLFFYFAFINVEKLMIKYLNNNNTYYGSIYQTDQGIQFHRVTLYKIEQSDCYWTYCKKYSTYMLVDIPKYSFYFTAVGNYQTTDSAWSLRELQASSGQCQINCKYCEIQFIIIGLIFQICYNCVKCKEYYQTESENRCISYDDETPYSKFLIKNEYFSRPSYNQQMFIKLQYSSYVLVSQDQLQQNNSQIIFILNQFFCIYYSIWQEQYIFGGQYVWSQAKFKITHQVQQPHHRVTIAFYILYGPNFSEDSQFIYTFENNQPVIKSKISATQQNFDTTLYEKVKFIHTHSSNTLTLYWECKGSNNNPINSYCGIYGYNVVVHYCQPYCLECLSEVSCTKWDTDYNLYSQFVTLKFWDYNSVNVKLLTEKGCQINSYYNKQELKCLSCPESCQTCTSDIHCQSCKLTFTLSKSRCICLMNQYYANNECFECPIGCNQCINDQVCVECQAASNRKLIDGKCICVSGHYGITHNPICQKCYSQSTCSCSQGASYDVASDTCKSCHASCQTCFRLSNDGCLSCNINNNRILQGLKCVCMPGYFEQNNSCQSCPNIEQETYVFQSQKQFGIKKFNCQIGYFFLFNIFVASIQCYKQCDQNSLIWHTQGCIKCDTGFQLVYGQCMPICGDFLIVGYEQCEDGNNDLNDLCFNCQYQCPSDCSTCTSTTTLPCTGYCGDMIVNGNEECDDGNQIQYDGCHNCKFQCSSNCTNCFKGKCTQCVTKKKTTSFSMSSQNCLQQCQFGQIIESTECMNDTFSIIDQCQQCRFNCRSNCSNCDYTTGTCLDCDLPGFKPYSSFCKNICGDGIIVQDPINFYTEYCDDIKYNNEQYCQMGSLQ